MLKIGIIGAGEGGTSILNTFISMEDIEIIGICDEDKNAPGIKLAKEKNIPFYDDFKKLINKKGEKIILEVTGNKKLSELIKENADNKTKVIDYETSHIIFKIVNSREKMINKIENEAENLSDLAVDISSTIKEVSQINRQNIKDLNDTTKKLTKASEDSKENLNKTNKIVKFIKDVSEQTKMLGLNAAIEAARADQNTSGFNVVANEIRNLADETSESVKEITNFIEKLNDSTENTRENIEKMSEKMESFNKNEKELTNKLNEAAEEINKMADVLSELSD